MKANEKIMTAGAAAGPVVETIRRVGGTPPCPAQVILVPVDFSCPVKPALHYAATLARTGNARIILLQVLSPQQAPVWRFDYARAAWGLDTQAQADAERRLAHLAGELVPPGIPVETCLRFGPPAAAILEVAAQTGTNLIVLTTHGHAWLAHLLLGSVAARVCRLAPCPVLVVREHEQEWQPAPPAAPAT